MANYLLFLIPILFPMAVSIILSLIPSINDSKSHKVAVATVIINALLVGLIFDHGMTGTLFELSRHFKIAFQFDTLSMIFVILISLIWIVVTVYATQYLNHEKHIKRFYIFFLLTLGTMIGIALSANLVTFYLFYELMTLTTYPLVVHSGEEQAKRAGIQYLAYSFIGAALALVGIFILTGLADSNDFVVGGLFNQPATVNTSLLVAGYFIGMLGLGAKAGMYPLHAWLAKAHPVAPAPASAVLSGVITKAGVLGMLRLTYYTYGTDLIRGSWAQWTLIILSLITIFLGSMLALRAKQMKIRLAYSSISQVSYAVLGIVLMNQDAFTGAILQVISHSIIKNLLFLLVGAIMYKTSIAHNNQLKGLARRMPKTMMMFTIASLALIGIPPLSGFISKYYLALGSLADPNSVIGLIGVIVLILSSLLTAGYLLPMAISAFFGKESDDIDMPTESNELKWQMTLPLMILSAGTLIMGLFPEPIIQLVQSIWIKF